LSVTLFGQCFIIFMKYRRFVFLVYCNAVLLTACDQYNATSDKKIEEKQNIATAETLAAAPIGKEPETTPVESKIQAIEEAVTSKSITENSKNIVENLGFSTPDKAMDFATPFNNGDTGKRFCLDLNSDELNPQEELTVVEESCTSISKRLASVSMEMCQTAKLRSTQCHSVNGFPLLLSEFSALDNKQPQGRILLIGGTHGDELTSVSIVFRWIEKSKNGEDPRRYPGEQPNSEPETQWLVDEINEFQPDAIISVHAPYGMVDFDSHLLNTAPKTLGKLHLNLLGTYPGSLGNYAGINRNIPVITLELPHAWVMPKTKESNQIWDDLIGWLSDNINKQDRSVSQK